MRFAHEPTDAHAWHAEVFGSRIDNKRTLWTISGYAARGRLEVDAIVYGIFYYEDVVLASQLGESLKASCVINTTSGIARTIDEQNLYIGQVASCYAIEVFAKQLGIE